MHLSAYHDFPRCKGVYRCKWGVFIGRPKQIKATKKAAPKTKKPEVKKKPKEQEIWINFSNLLLLVKLTWVTLACTTIIELNGLGVPDRRQNLGEFTGVFRFLGIDNSQFCLLLAH